MRNYDQKHKDMIESVLPSTARRKAREERRRIHKRDRARVAQVTQRYRKAVDPEDVEADPRHKARGDLAEMVHDRRDADKVAPLVRWALRRLAADPKLRDAAVVEQVQVFRGLFPANVIGRHAVGHIEQALEWQDGLVPWGSIRPAGPPAERISRRLTQVLAILHNGQHAELNTRIRALLAAEQSALSAVPDTSFRRGPLRSPRRLLLGLHDAASFTDSVVDSAGICAILDALTGLELSDPPAILYSQRRTVWPG